QVLKESMIERNEQLSELKNLFSYLEEHRSLKGYDGLKTSRSSALLSKNGTSVGESDTMRTPRNPPILFAYLLAYLQFPACIRVYRKRLCTDYKVDIGCTSCILYDLCHSADGPSFKGIFTTIAWRIAFLQRCPYDGLTNLPPTTKNRRPFDSDASSLTPPSKLFLLGETEFRLRQIVVHEQISRYRRNHHESSFRRWAPARKRIRRNGICFLLGRLTLWELDLKALHFSGAAKRKHLSSANAPDCLCRGLSSEDDYTPLENVDQIQVDVLDQLRERLGSEIDIKLTYQDEEQL
ncbi:hypothetical protein ALC62_03499, partial [Cyphomyrmex costatus]